MSPLLLAFVAFGSAVLFHMRGGWLMSYVGMSDPEARALYAVGMPVLLAAVTLNPWLLLLPASFYLSCLIPLGVYKTGQIDLTTKITADKLVLLAARGVLWTAPPIAGMFALWWVGLISNLWPVWGLLGAAEPVAELIGCALPLEVIGFRKGPELSEPFVGALIGVSLALALAP